MRLLFFDNQCSTRRKAQGPSTGKRWEEDMLRAVAVPGTVAQVHALLGQNKRSALVAGGTLIIPVLNYGTDAFDTLISLRGAGLSSITVRGTRVEIGAAATLAEVGKQRVLEFLSPALLSIGSPTLRNMATVGGNLFAPCPYGDFAACLVSLGAEAAISGSSGRRSMPVERLLAEGLQAGEIVTSVAFDLPEAGSFRYRKAARRTYNSGSIVTVAAVVSQEAGVVCGCRIALGGVASTAVRAPSVEQALMGKPLDRPHVEAAAALAVDEIAPQDDAYASAWYRRRVTPVHVRRALLGE
jgi:CO/xanthine dehydrogenase FAD-binding subunit